MSQNFLFNFKNSIANYLLKKVFAIYLIIALSVTLIHMAAEYQIEKNNMIQELKSLQQIFQPGLALALWHVDNDQLRSTLKGVIQQPSLVGVKLEFGKKTTGIGTITNPDGQPITLGHSGKPLSSREFSNLFSHQFPILYDYEGDIQQVGYASFYSSHTIVFQKLKYGFMFIVINAIIKTVALWWIFLVMGRRFLSMPLYALTKAIEQLNLDNLQEHSTKIKVPEHTELKTLENAFNSMADKLSSSRKKLEESYESLRRADKMVSLGVLVAGMAHEVNNPNNFIKINIRILKDTWHDTINYLRRYEQNNEAVILNGMTLDYAEEHVPILIEGIDEGADRISGIVKNLKDYARDTSIDINGQVNINIALNSSLLLLKNELEKKTNHLSIKQKENIPFFKGDIKRIEQVILNLIHNACDALENNEQAIYIRTDCVNDHIILKIKDEGAGIAPEHLHQIYDPFFTTKQNSNGTGLGLSISSGIVKEHQGHIEFISTPQQGTTITVSFPIQQSLS